MREDSRHGRMAASLWLLLFAFIGKSPGSIAARLLDTSVSCDQDNFVLAVNFDSTFRGIVYSEEGFPNCVYVNGSMLPQKSYNLKIPLDGCDTHRNKEGNLENAIIVQDNAAFLQSTDKKYLLTCIPSANDHSSDNMLTVDFGGVTVENRHTTTEVISATLPPNALMPAANLKYHVEIRAGHDGDARPLTSPLSIGDPISYIVRLEKPIAESQIGRCWATDAKSNLELSDDHGCTIQHQGRIWMNFERSESSKEFIFTNKIRAWAFPTSNEVNIYCNLRVCMSRSCTFSNCTNSGPRRHRRNHYNHPVSDIEEFTTVSTKIRFRRNADKTPANQTTTVIALSESQTTVCLTLVHLGLISACVFAVLIIAVLAVFVLMPVRKNQPSGPAIR